MAAVVVTGISAVSVETLESESDPNKIPSHCRVGQSRAGLGNEKSDFPTAAIPPTLHRATPNAQPR